MENIPVDNTIVFHITMDQAMALLNHYGCNIENYKDNLECEVCALLDRYIDELQ